VRLFGYSFGAGFVVIALAKSIVPAHTGAWVQDGQVVSAGAFIYGVPPAAHEVLGMWIIPLGLIAGSLTLLLTTYLIRTSLRVSQRVQARL
jgi:cytochrome c-type biogenesis protein CcmH/NrfF